MTAAVPLVERLAEVERAHGGYVDGGIGNGWRCWCGADLRDWWPTGGVTPRDSALNAALRAHRTEALLPVVEQAVAEARGEALREAAAEGERVERIGLTPASQIDVDEREWFDKHPLRNVDGFQRHRPVIANWLRALADVPAAADRDECPGDHAGPCFEGRPDMCRDILRDDHERGEGL